MNRITRGIVFFAGVVLLLPALVAGVYKLPAFGVYQGPYGFMILDVAEKERHVLNAVTAVIFDYRGFDTLGEQFILYTAVTGVVLLLRKEKEQEEGYGRPRAIEPGHGMSADVSESVVMVSSLYAGLLVVYGLYTVLTGHLSVGGGFQGGVIISSAWILICFAYGTSVFHRVTSRFVVEFTESAGASVYVLTGLAALFCGRLYLTNVLPLGQSGQLLSGGTIFLIDCGVGVEVASGFLLLTMEFLKPFETTPPRRLP